jgi:hypothetical protein
MQLGSNKLLTLGTRFTAFWAWYLQPPGSRVCESPQSRLIIPSQWNPCSWRLRHLSLGRRIALVIWHSFKIRQGVHYHNYRLGSLILIITVVYLLCFLKIQNKKVISTHLTATKQELTSHHSLFLTTSSIVEATK